MSSDKSSDKFRLKTVDSSKLLMASIDGKRLGVRIYDKVDVVEYYRYLISNTTTVYEDFGISEDVESMIVNDFDVFDAVDFVFSRAFSRFGRAFVRAVVGFVHLLSNPYFYVAFVVSVSLLILLLLLRGAT